MKLYVFCINKVHRRAERKYFLDGNSKWSPRCCLQPEAFERCFRLISDFLYRFLPLLQRVYRLGYGQEFWRPAGHECIGQGIEKGYILAHSYSAIITSIGIISHLPARNRPVSDARDSSSRSGRQASHAEEALRPVGSDRQDGDGGGDRIRAGG